MLSMTAAALLVLIAFLMTLYTRETNKVPLWIPLLFIEIAMLITAGAGLVVRG